MAQVAGEVYSVGDIGPAGGVVFITPSTSGNTTGYYFEVAPSSFAASRTWAQSTPVNYQSTSVSGADGTAIGTGYQNTLDIIAQGNSTSTTSAAAYCRSLTINNYNDWFLPSKDEVNQIYLNIPISGFGTTAALWTSSEATSTQAYLHTFNGSSASTLKSASNTAAPVRMFSAGVSKYPETSDIVRYGSPLPTQRIGNDDVYGGGFDGNVTISVNTTLSGDMYYNNLTINPGIVLNPNGFRVFVKNTLTVNGTLGIGSGVTVSPGTVSGTSGIGVVPSFSIGGNAQTSTSLTLANTYVLNNIENAIRAADVSNAGAVRPITGGAGGVSGAAGTVTPATAGGAGGSGSPGSPGGAGGAGHLVKPAGQSGAPGTDGTPGSAGGSGTPGTPGTTPPAAAAGVGGKGSGVVVIIAKTITGTGIIVANGETGTSGGASATGSAGSAGSAGSPGANGSAGTSGGTASLAHYADGNAHYDGHGHHRSVASPNLPHGSHVPHAFSPYHQQPFRQVHNSNTSSHGSSNHPSHGHTPPGHTGHGLPAHHAPVNAADYTHINGIPHTAHGHRNHSGTAQVHYGTHYGGNYNLVQHYPHYQHNIKGGHVHDYYLRQHHDNDHQQYIVRPAGTVSHVGHASYPAGAGGSAGSGGAGGSAGTAGIAGSTTAGTAGKSGGGGGIIIVTETSTGLPTTSVTGGTSASSGLVALVLNK